MCFEIVQVNTALSLSQKKKKKFFSFHLLWYLEGLLYFYIFSFSFFSPCTDYVIEMLKLMCLGFTVASQRVYTLYLFITTFLYFLSIPNNAKSMLGAHSGKLWCTRVPYAQCQLVIQLSCCQLVIYLVPSLRHTAQNESLKSNQMLQLS